MQRKPQTHTSRYYTDNAKEFIEKKPRILLKYNGKNQTTTIKNHSEQN